MSRALEVEETDNNNLKKNADFVEYKYKNVLASLPLVYIRDFQLKRGNIVLGIFAEFIQIDIGFCCLVEVQKNPHDVDYGMYVPLEYLASQTRNPMPAKTVNQMKNKK